MNKQFASKGESSTDGHNDFEQIAFHYERPAELSGQPGSRKSVTIVGAGPVGLSAAIDLAGQGVKVVLLDDDYRLSTGSRAICFSKRTLEIFDRLGCAEPMVAKGVSWQRGKVFLKDELIYAFDLQPEAGFKHPAFINLQQYYVEGYLAERAQSDPNIEIRWRNKVTTVTQQADHVVLVIDTPDGSYSLTTDWLLACDGSRSPIRNQLGLESTGRTFKDRFLIADVRMTAPFPTERWFWFDPPFHPNQSVLLHKQPDDVWRIDFQLGWDADPEEEKKPENVLPRVQALLGGGVKFDLEWVSVYTFSCLRMERFRYDRVIFAGDSAHGVSPFGARGANSGVQDAENIAWKLARVVAQESPASLLETYNDERCLAADENILNSTRSTDFITPKSAISRVFRDATLNLSRDAPFARVLVNSGRLSTPSHLHNSPLNTADTGVFSDGCSPGAPAVDAPVTLAGVAGWLTDYLSTSFGLLICPGPNLTADTLAQMLSSLKARDSRAHCLIISAPNAPVLPFELPASAVGLVDADEFLANRYDLQPGTAYLIRPDQHIVARSRTPNPQWLQQALSRATGLVPESSAEQSS